MKKPGYYENSAYGLLCLSAVRRLFQARNGEHGKEARESCKKWIADLRIIRELEKGTP